MIRKGIRTFNYYWSLLIPFGMAATAIYYQSPFSTMLIWAGWLVFVLHILLFGQIKKVLWEELPTILPYFILRIPLILLIPTFDDYLTVKDYFYSEVLAETISILLILIAFMFFYKQDGESVYKDAGLGINLLALTFILTSLFPFIVVIYLHFISTGLISILYALAILIPGLFFNFKLFKRYADGDINAEVVGQDNDSLSFMIIIGIFGWFILLGIFHALVSNHIL